MDSVCEAGSTSPPLEPWKEEGAEIDERLTEPGDDVLITTSNAAEDNLVDWSALRGVAEPRSVPDNDDVRPYNTNNHHTLAATHSVDDLENLAELVPDIKTRAGQPNMMRVAAASGLLGMHHHTDPVVLDDDGAPQVEVLVHDPQEKHMKKKDIAHEPKKTEKKSEGFTSHNSKQPHHPHAPLKLSHAAPRHAKELDDDDGSYPDSEHVLEDTHLPENTVTPHGKMDLHHHHLGSSANSISTATQTHEVRMPMYLPTFKPATGCTNASDFIVRCFVARLRSGITVVKHGRSRWCKSRLRVLHIHPDGRSLSWKPAEGEPASSKRPPKLDLSTCLEVRHAWSPDPSNPMYTGTAILRQKCEAANAHKSFALIFKSRTVDITAVTADQCKVLMEGFSALCFRLQVATLAGRTTDPNKTTSPLPEEDGVSTTASNTLTNTSLPKVR